MKKRYHQILIIGEIVSKEPDKDFGGWMIEVRQDYLGVKNCDTFWLRGVTNDQLEKATLAIYTK